MHQARNSAWKQVRGEYGVYLDSDDEMVPNQISIFLNAWNNIPFDEQQEYFEVCCPCMNGEGTLIGKLFPNNINSLDWTESRKIFYNPKTERHNMLRSAIMKQNLMPEPEGITLVKENLLWGKLKLKYKTYYINDILRIYHQEDDMSYTRNKQYQYSIQGMKNSRWMIEYYLNHWDEYEFTLKQHIIWLKKYCILNAMLLNFNCGIEKKLLLTKKADRFFYKIIYIPCTIKANRNIKKFRIEEEQTK